jgi:hypothetical protein
MKFIATSQEGMPPFRYSESQFSELLPPKLSEFLRSKARLKELIRADGSWLNCAAGILALVRLSAA